MSHLGHFLSMYMIDSAPCGMWNQWTNVVKRIITNINHKLEMEWQQRMYQ